MSYLKRILNVDILRVLTLEQRKTFWLILLLMLVFGLVEAFTYSIIVPYLNVVIDPKRIYAVQELKPVIDYFGWTDSMNLVVIISVVFLGFYTLKTSLHLILQYWISKFPYDIARFNMNRLYVHYFNLPYDQFLKKNQKDMMKVLSQSIPRLSNILIQLLYFYSYLITSAFLIGILFKKQFLFAFFIIVVFGITGILIYSFFKKRQRQSGLDYEEGFSSFFKKGLESFQLIKEIKLFDRTVYFKQLISNAIYRVTGALKVSSFISGLPGILMEYIVIVILVVVAYLLVIFVEEPQNYGTLFIFYAVVGRRLLSCLGFIITNKSSMENLKPSLENIFNELSLEKLERQLTPRKFENQITSFETISFDHITFGYTNSSQVLNAISFKIKRNQSVAFVGASGSGKSTLIDILLSFLKPNSGVFSVDGNEVSSLEILWSKIAYVPQMMTILDDTLANNIALGETDIDYDKLKKVIKMSYLEDVVSNLELGVDTLLGDMGIQLSGGQRQRVAIARALYTEPEILIFDEATSSLDSLSEKQISDSIASMKGQVTIIVIAHRLSTVKDFDCIYVLDKGSIVGSGTHEELDQSNSFYKELVKLGKL